MTGSSSSLAKTGTLPPTADVLSDAAPASRSWQRAVLAVWTAAVALAAAKVAVAAWGGWTLAASGTLGGRLPFAVTLLLFGLTGALFIAGGGRDRRVRCLGAFFIVIASAYAHHLIPQAAAGFAGSVIAELRRLPTDAFLPLMLWLFVHEFPSAPKPGLPQRAAGGFVAASAWVGALFFAANVRLAHGGATARPSWVATALQWLDRDSPTLAYWPVLFTITGVALPYLVWKLRFETVEAKQRGVIFIVALVAGITPMLVTVVATPFVPALRDPSRRVLIGWVLYGALISVIPSAAYAVFVKRVMDVRLILRKTSQHALARYAVWLVSIGPLTYLFVDMYMRRGIPAAEIEESAAIFIVSLLGFGVLMFRDPLLRRVDKWFLRGAVDYAEALARVERDLRRARSLREIAQLVTREITRTIHPARIAMFVVDDHQQQLAALEGTWRPLDTRSVLVELLHQIRSDLQFDPRPDGPIARLLPPGDRAWLAEGQLSLLCPLVDSTGRLLGIVGMGESRGGLPYTKQDRMFVTSIAGQAAMQFENRALQEAAGEERGHARPRGLVPVDWDKEPGAHCTSCGRMWPGNVRDCSCGTATVPAALPIMVKGKFRVERWLGSGGMGVVYLAIDVTLDRKVAVKTLPSVTPDRVAWLQREARAMAAVLHPNLALIYGVEEWRGTLLLIVEYLEGGTLLEQAQRGALDVAEVVDLGIVLADVLDRVHASGVLHRDIKPSNIAYTKEGIPKLLDFGVAAIVDLWQSDDELQPGSETGTAGDSTPLHTFTSSARRLAGTPLYLSPEAVAGEPPHPSFDLWSLSLVLHEVLTGHHPFAAETVDDVIDNIRKTQVPDVRDLRPDCPPELAALLRDSLSPIARRRPPTATALRTRLQRVRAGLDSARP